METLSGMEIFFLVSVLITCVVSFSGQQDIDYNSRTQRASSSNREFINGNYTTEFLSLPTKEQSGQFKSWQ